MSSNKLSPQDLVTAAETVLCEAIRIQTLPAQERMAHLKDNKEEAFAWLQGHPDYGYFECGSKGTRAFQHLLDYFLDINPQLVIDASHEVAELALTYVFLDRFVKHRAPINWDTLQSVFARACKHLLAKQAVRRYAYPCALWSTEGPDRVDVGPVCFRRSDAFFKQEAFYRSEDHFRHVEEEAQEFARRAGRVASVDIESIDETTGADRAKRTIDAAINVLQLFIGAERTRRCRRAETFDIPGRYASYFSDNEGRLCTTLTMGGHDDLVWDDWWECFQGMYAPFFRMAGEALHAIQHSRTAWGLQERFLGSLSWFGDGVRDQNLAARLTKYVFSWERLVITRTAERSAEDSLNELLAKRIALLCSNCRANRDDTEESARKAYDVRSRLAHGAISPWPNGEVLKVLYRAERITQQALFGALMHYASLHESDGSDAALEASFSN